MSRIYKGLIIAPQFPAINQPWIDTYLEQLLVHRIEPSIYSNSRATHYSPKVDRLELRKRVLPLSLERGDVFKGAICAVAAGRVSRKLIRDVTSLGGRGRVRLANLISGLHLSNAPIDPIDFIHSHDEILAYRFLILAKVRSVPLILTFHGLPPVGVTQLSTDKRKVLYQEISLVIVNTEYAKHQVCGLGCDPAKVRVLPQGLPIAEFPFQSRRAPDAGEQLALLTVGRFHRDKGQGYVLIALRRLLDSGLQARWDFVGVGPDLDRLRKLARRLSLEAHVGFHVALPPDRLREFYCSSHLFVLPSVDNPGGHVETQGVVLQEAQASGCIPIASRVGGIPECLNDQIDALLFKQKSSRDLVEKISWMVSHPDVWEGFQREGRKNVESNYSSSVIGEKMASLLKGLSKMSGA